VQSYRLRDEGFADAGLTDQQQRQAFFEPDQRVDFFDLCLVIEREPVKSKSSKLGRNVKRAALIR